MNKFRLEDYYCDLPFSQPKEYYENLVLQDILNGTASKGTINYYNDCKNVKQIIDNVYLGYQAELKVLNMLNTESNKHWKFIDENAGYYRLGSTAASNAPDLISDDGITVEVKSGKTYGYIAEYVEFKSLYNLAEVCYEHLFHNADYVILYDRYKDKYYRFNKQSFIDNATYTINKFNNRVYVLNLTRASL